MPITAESGSGGEGSGDGGGGHLWGGREWWERVGLLAGDFGFMSVFLNLAFIPDEGCARKGQN